MIRMMSFIFGAALAACLLGGCASPTGTVAFEISADRYGEAIEVARTTLREARFTVDRVDAQEGIVTTHAKSTAGLGTPWDKEQATLLDEVSDFVNQHERVVRVMFTGHDEPDLSASGVLAVEVEVVVYRVRRGGWRVETESISRSRHARDPLAASRGQPGTFRQATRRDDVFAAHLADEMRSRLGIPSVANENEPASVTAVGQADEGPGS